MGADTFIEWATHTFNPWIGCTKVSPGCDHCYAETWDARGMHLQPRRWGAHANRTRTSNANWRQPLAWNKAEQAAGVRARVFCASLADVFDNHGSILPEWRSDLWKLIAATPHLDWLLLTKRPQNIAKMLPDDWGKGWPNVWLGTTVENQTEAYRRIPHLLAVPAHRRFLSCEPMLGPIDLERVWMDRVPHRYGDSANLSGLHWVICGGESGKDARPMHLDWARSLRDQCIAAEVAFHFKQWGEWSPCVLEEGDEGEPGAAYPMVGCSDPSVQNEDQPARFWLDDGTLGYWTDVVSFPAIGVRRVGKKAAGRLLDGRTWDEVPMAVQP